METTNATATARPAATRFVNRDEAITTIRTNLRKRGLKWVTVRGGRGTAWGWIDICAAPKASTDGYGRMSDAQRAELAAAMGLESVHPQGISIPSSNAYYIEHMDRSAGVEPSVIGEPYWD